MGLFSSVGSFFNDISGATSSAKLNNKYQKEFAQNAHQWEVKDLQKAGLNPVLSAGGSGASASGGGSGNQASLGVTDIANSATNLIGTLSGKEKNDADIKNTNADTAGKLIENDLITPKAEAQIKEAYSRMAINSAKKAEAEANKKLIQEKTRTEAVKDVAKKQARNKYHSASQQIKDEIKYINKAKDQKEFNRRMLLGLN